MKNCNYDGAQCAHCVAYQCGCCALTDLAVDEADTCPDYRPDRDLEFTGMVFRPNSVGIRH